MKLFIDECLSPTLVVVCNNLNYEAACNRDRGMLHWSDPAVLDWAYTNNSVIVTNNGADFQELCEGVDLHPGLIIMSSLSINHQQESMTTALMYIERESQDQNEDAADWMINKVVDVDSDQQCCWYDLPEG